MLVVRHTLALIAALAGCDVVLGLNTRAPDAGVPPPVIDVAGRRTSYIGPGDYDGDGLSNDTDACPMLAGQDDANADGDALPDACDPDIGELGRDCIVLFDAWTDTRPAAIDPLWVGRPTPWLVGTCDGSNRALCQPTGSPALLYADADLSVARVEVEMRMASRTLPTSRALVFMNLAPDLPDVSGRGCGLSGNLQMASQGTFTINRGVVASVVSGPVLAISDGDDVTISVSASRVCTARNARSGLSATTNDMTEPAPAGSLIGVHLVDATVQLHYVLAYGKTCP